MKLKLILKSVISFILVGLVVLVFAGCKDDLSKLFDEGELGDFWDLKNDDAKIVDPEKSHDDDFIGEDDVLNMDMVKRLAFGDISPFTFMDKFPGSLDGTDPIIYYAGLPNDYWVRIEYSGDTVSLVALEDHRLNKSIDLKTQKIQIDEFLQERGD